MTYLEGYRSKELCETVVREIHRIANRPLLFMEVCGGHTMAIRKFGIPSLLPPNISLLSGPGCPVCVTSRLFIDQAIFLAKRNDSIVCTYGDLLRVKGSESSLERIRGEGCRVSIIFSSMDALQLARENPGKKVIFAAIGFETTSPATAAAILLAKKQRIKNFYVLSAHKIMPPAMEAIVNAGIPINGFICPGHVSAITGTATYSKLAANYRVGCVISGFEPLDLFQSLLMLARQTIDNDPKVENQYSRAVKPEGNMKAIAMMNEVFEPVDDWWRGLGILKNSGLKPRKEFINFDASACFDLPEYEIKEPKDCICGAVLRGVKKPTDCRLFANICTPENPVGACMVSSEGACQTFYTYDRKQRTDTA